MFVDYYAILEINFDASQDSIKAAFYTQAMKWHPDKNPGIDTNNRMQQINEAYLILKDAEARQRYDKEYQRYNEYQEQTQYYRERQRQKEQGRPTNSGQKQEQYTGSFTDSAYEIFDDILSTWMSNARKQAVDLAKQTIEDIKGMSKASGQAMGDAAIKGVVRYLVFGVIMFVVFKTCGR
jgi:curved DNA-binding protein CbpA